MFYNISIFFVYTKKKIQVESCYFMTLTLRLFLELTRNNYLKKKRKIMIIENSRNLK